MCGRYTQHHSTDQVVMRFDVTTVVHEPSARYNAAPTQFMPVVLQTPGARILDSFKWGLIPSWAKEASIGSKMLNARAESLSEKPSFRSAFKRRRCLVPADGYYEWKKLGKVKQPYYFRRRDEQLFALAGLWEEWMQPDGTPLRSFTVITTSPNELAAATHDRMPAILLPHNEAVWLNGEAELSQLEHILSPYPADVMEAYEVSSRVNTPSVDEPSLIRADGHSPPSDRSSLFEY